MGIVHLDHFNIAPANEEETVRFYVEVVGLRVGPRPDFGVPGYWLYAGDRAVLHTLVDPSRSTGPTGRMDHIAFWATGLAEMVDRLQRLGIPFKLRTVDVAGMHQLFLNDPDGVTLEIGYPLSEPVPEDAGRIMGLGASHGGRIGDA